MSSVFVRFFAIVVPLLLSVSQSALARGDPRARTDIDKALAEQLYREQQSNRGYEIAVCETARSKSARGGKIACHVAKTWPDIDIRDRILKGAMDWPWGHVQCEVAIEQKLIVASVSGPRYEVKVGKHDVVCQIETKDGKNRHTVNLTIDPVVTFEKRQGYQSCFAVGQSEWAHNRRERPVVGNRRLQHIQRPARQSGGKDQRISRAWL